jgi:tryptophan synthase alpha chain
MSYANPVLAFGTTALAEAAAAAGVDGLIVPDLPPEEAGELRAACGGHGVATIFLVAPTSGAARVPAICRAATGYVYYVALRGVTGIREVLPPDLSAGIARVRAATDLPVAVGFGVSTPEQVAAVAREADGVIVGSALVRAVEAQLEAGGGLPDVVARAGEFAAALRAATARPAAAARA